MRVLIFVISFLIVSLKPSAQFARSSITQKSPMEYSLTALGVKGNVTSIVEKYYGYDKAGQVESKPELVITYVFDEKGKVVTKEYVGEKRIKYSIKLNDEGRPVEIVASGDTSWKRIIEYSTTGNTIKSTWFNEKIVLDGKGFMTEWTWGSSEKYPTLKYSYEYDSYGRISQIHQEGDLSYPRDFKGKYWHYQYDAKNNVLSTTRTEYARWGDYNTKIKYSYQYDSQNNWTSRITTIDEENTIKITREYKYADQVSSNVKPQLVSDLRKEFEKIIGSQIPFALVEGVRKVETMRHFEARKDQVRIIYELSENGRKNLETWIYVYYQDIKKIELTKETANYYELTLTYSSKAQRNVYSRIPPTGNPETLLAATDTCILYISKKADIQAVIKALEASRL